MKELRPSSEADLGLRWDPSPDNRDNASTYILWVIMITQ